MVWSNRWARIVWTVFVLVVLTAATAAANCVEGDCRNGKGRYEWANGAAYAGDFKGGAFDGSGTYTFPGGAQYTGQWVNDKKSGIGTYSWPDGKSYEGRWVDDQKEGYGVFKWPDGTMYKGNFKNNQRHGFGTYSWPNGASYEGEWATGKKHGAGIYSLPDGSQMGGTWEADQQTVKRDAADVRAYLDTLRAQQSGAAPAAPAVAVPAAAMAAGPATPATAGEPAESRQAADDKETMETSTPIEAAAAGSSQSTPATAFQMAVMDAPMGSGEKVAGLIKKPLVTFGDHRPAGEITVNITPSAGKEKGYTLSLAVENKSQCHLNFDSFIRVDDTYFPLASWRGDQAVAPGGTQQTSVDVTVGSDLFGEDVVFKGQGFAERCGG
ncbi:MAG: hypothetical protein ABIL58_01280 [Pseudomonadota bacterium]